MKEHKGGNHLKTALSDKELYEAFLAGDHASFDALMSKYRVHLIGFIQSYVRNLEVAEDLAQDVFVNLLIKRKKYDFKYSMKTYLFTIARSRAINYLKKEKPISLEEYHIAEQDLYENSIEEGFIAKERDAILYNAIQKLCEKQRVAVYLADLEGLSNKEVGKALGKSVSETKMILYRARKNLKKLLEQECFTNER
ncbi:MAG: RNA polymerase sigma factor [Clostridia bacterium]|nr:RNA polymerase sigma factor [Clostridia bacterium]